jgi:hypothetical protein
MEEREGARDEELVSDEEEAAPEEEAAAEEAKLVSDEEEAAAEEAGSIGGRAGDEDLDPAERPVIEGGGGEAEGRELAEEELREHAEHGGGED